MANNIKGITIEIDGNTTKLSKALSSVNKDLKSTQSALKDVDKLLDLDPKNTVLLEQKQRLLADAVDKTKDKLNLLKDAQVQAADALTKGDIGQDEYDALSRQIIATENELKGYEEQAESANDAVDLDPTLDEFRQAGEEANNLTGDVKGVGEQSEGTSSIWSSAWSTMAGGLGALGIKDLVEGIVDKIKDVSKYILEAAEDWEDSAAIMAQGTGATSEDLEDLTSSAYDCWKQLKDCSMSAQDVASALGEANTRFGVTGDAAEEFTTKVSSFAKVTGEDAASSVDLLADIIRQWGGDIEDSDRLMDELVYSAQACGDSASDLGTALADNAYQWQTLGYSQEDALELMSKVAWAGGDVSDVTSGMTKAISALSGQVDDVPGTFQLAIEQMENWDGESDILQQTIGDTGLTIEDVFGKKAQTMAQALSTASQNTTEFSYCLDDCSGRMQQTADDSVTLKDEWSELTNRIKAGVSKTAGPALTSFLHTVNSTLDGADQKMQESKQEWADYSGVKSSWAETKASMKSDFDQMVEINRQRMQKMKEDASDKWAGIKEKWNSGLASIKQLINGTSWSLPHISLPHFSTSGKFSLNPLSVPKISVSWYKKAYENAYALDGATIFGASGSGLLGGGEGSGREIILGEKYLQDTMVNAFRQAFGYMPSSGNTSNTYEGSTINVYGAPGQDVNELANIIEQKMAMNVRRRAAW